MQNNVLKKKPFKNQIIMIGFGSIGQTILPLLFQHLNIKPSQISIVSKNNVNPTLIEQFGVNFRVGNITISNYQTLIGKNLQKNDLLLNMSVGVSSVDLIKLCEYKQTLYLDLSTEPWARSWYTDPSLSPAQRTNYALREDVIKLKTSSGPTAVVTHGANPGIVSHFVKQALINIAQDNEINVPHPETSLQWASLAKLLDIKSIHISERDTQVTNNPKKIGVFANTWSVDGLLAESSQPAELGWGTHERHWPHDGYKYQYGAKSSIFLGRPGASVRVRTWSPSHGSFHGFLISHAESISISNYLTIQEDNQIHYRPTVHYAYMPCPQAILSLHEFAGNEWQQQDRRHIIFNEIIDGSDELGVLLMGNQKGAYWYGSTLSIREARKHIPYANATTLQVAAGAIAAIIWMINNPKAGVVEPEDLDYKFILDIANPYLGQITGCYTDWSPIKNRERLFAETVDKDDPWQFINIRVS